MSIEEKNIYEKVSGDLRVIKRWIPIISVILIVFGFVIRYTNKATTLYDTELMKKEDLQPIAKRLDIMAAELKNLTEDFRNFKNTRTVNRSVDSIEQLNIKKAVERVNREVQTIVKKYYGLSGYTEKYYIDRKGERIITVAPVQ